MQIHSNTFTDEGDAPVIVVFKSGLTSSRCQLLKWHKDSTKTVFT